MGPIRAGRGRRRLVGSRDVDEPDGAKRGGTGTSEVFIRGQMRAWLDYMTAP